jgi:AcrR family transcriptional regulator
VTITAKQCGSRAGKSGQARTRLARAAVVRAARTLFPERGYAGTTVEAISDGSDVAPATVYRLFSSKLGILKALLDVSIAGDDETIPLADRDHVRALLADPDPKSQLSGFAGITRGIMSRTEPVHRILVSAAASDSGPELREREAADIIHALMSPEVYRLLAADRGWRPPRYERWLTRILIDQLLPPPTCQRERTPECTPETNR